MKDLNELYEEMNASAIKTLREIVQQFDGLINDCKKVIEDLGKFLDSF